MDEKAKEAELKVQSEAWLPAKAIRKAKKAEAKVTREIAHEAKREAKEAKLVAKAIKKAIKVEAKATRRDEIITRHERNRRATVDQRARQAEIGLTRDLEVATIKQAEKEVIETEEKDKRGTEETREVEIDTEADAKVQEDRSVNDQLHEGVIKLLLMPPVSALQIINLERKLRMAQNLRVISTCGSVDKPSTIVVSADQPIPLVDVLSQIPIVDQVIKKGNEIRILLKAETYTSISI